MDKKILTIALACIMVLPAAFASIAVVCNSEDPLHIELQSSLFRASGDFSIRFKNESGETMNILAVSNDGPLVFEDVSTGVIENGGEVNIEGHLSPDNYPINEKIIVQYLNAENQEKETVIHCAGMPPPEYDPTTSPHSRY